jgi:hypothetical protein
MIQSQNEMVVTMILYFRIRTISFEKEGYGYLIANHTEPHIDIHTVHFH